MNKSEQIALEYLHAKGIEIKDNTKKGTPDFLSIKEGAKNYEVKRAYNNKILFYPNQKEKMNNASIIVIKDEKVVDVLPFEELKKKYEITEVPPKYSLVVEEDLYWRSIHYGAVNKIRGGFKGVIVEALEQLIKSKEGKP